MQKVAVLGSTGMAGHVIALYLEEQSYDVYRVSRSQQPGPKSIAIDVRDFASLADWLDKVSPDIIVNCIGVLQRTSQEQPDLAILINSYLPHWLEKRYASSQTRIIQLSTDCVFSGKRGKYKEDDFRDGDTIYDRTKALGEIINKKDLTFRMSIIGPDMHPDGTGLFNWFMKQTGVISGYKKAIWNGITTIELARGIDAAIKQDICGLYQLVPQTQIDKYTLLCLFKKVFERDDIYITENYEVILDKSLVNTRNDFNYTIRSYEEQIKDMKLWIENHRELYRHYFR